MRKRVIDTVELPPHAGVASLPIESLAQVEVTSEAAEAPIEDAFAGRRTGWRAAAPGEQTIRIILDQPQRVRRITLKFVEGERLRTQEFVLKWSSDTSGPAHTIVRQQWTFSPSGSTTESEVYDVDLSHVRVLELVIKPDIGDSTAIASLAEWRVFTEGS